MIGNETDEIIEDHFECLLQIYQEVLQEKIRGCEFVFDGADLLHDNLHKTTLTTGGSYIDCRERLKK